MRKQVSICLNCNSVIHYPNRRVQKYCNEECLREFRKRTKYHRKFIKPAPKQINCVVCDIPFKRKYGMKVTCSPRCARYRKRQTYEQYKGKIRIDMTLKEFRKWRKINA